MFEFFEKLGDREKATVIGGLALVLLIAVFAVSNRVIVYRNSLADRVVETRNQFVELDKLAKEYNYYRSLKTGQQESSNELISKVEQLLVKHALKESVSTMRDSTTVILKRYNKITIDISFRSVHLKDIFKMIYDIEVNKAVNTRVEYLNFRKPLAGKEIYDVNLKLSSYSKMGKKDA